MKITTLFSFILFFFCCQNVLSQKSVSEKPICVPGSPEYTVRYIKLKDLYIKMQSAESTKAYRALRNEFLDKSNFDYDGGKKEIIRQAKDGLNAIHEWALNNIEKTDFKNCEEAEALIKKSAEAYWHIIVDNKELYNYSAESLQICPDISFNLLLELKKEYGADLQVL